LFFVQSIIAGIKLVMEDVKSVMMPATAALTAASTTLTNSYLVSALVLLTAIATFSSMVYWLSARLFLLSSGSSL
jgi:hypothetical protein